MKISGFGNFEVHTNTSRLGRNLVAGIGQQRPDLVLALGLARGRAGISIERVAINVDDASMAYNAGLQPIDTPVVLGGPAAYQHLAHQAWRKACNKLGMQCTFR